MIGKRLSSIISESGLKKGDAAALIKVQPGTISNWIKNGNFRDNSKFFNLCKIKGWNPEWIITGEGEKFTVETVNESKPDYSLQSKVDNLEGQIIVLNEQLHQKDEFILKLLESCDDKELKKGQRSG